MPADSRRNLLVEWASARSRHEQRARIPRLERERHRDARPRLGRATSEQQGTWAQGLETNREEKSIARGSRAGCGKEAEQSPFSWLGWEPWGGVSSLTNETSGLRCEMQRGGRAAEGISGCVLDAASCICAASVPTLASQCISRYQGPATTCQKPGKTHGRHKPHQFSNVDICAAFCDTVD